MLLGLIDEFGVADDIRQSLFRKSRRQAETDTFIVDRLVAALQVLKGCQTKQQQREFRIALALVAPTRAAFGNQEGMAKRVSARLRVQRGKRSKRQGGRPYAFDASIDQRATFDDQAVAAARPKDQLAVGDAVLCRGELARLAWYDESTGRCGVTFSYEGVEETVPYTSRFHVKGRRREKGCARLQRPQPSLSPPPRAMSKLSVSSETKMHVREVFELTCPTSPHQKDACKRHLGRHVWQVQPRPLVSLPQPSPLPHSSLADTLFAACCCCRPSRP